MLQARRRRAVCSARWTFLRAVAVATAFTSALAPSGVVAQNSASAKSHSDSSASAVQHVNYANRITVRRAEIEAAGWKRIAELLEAAVGTSRNSVDGFVYSVSGDRTPNVGAPEWVVLVDGVRVAAGAFAMVFTELLPVSIEQVDSVRFTTGPAVVGRLPAARGAMELFTTPPQTGFSASGTFAIGDETGDPGPFRYTELATPNVEKIGPFVSARASYQLQRIAMDVLYHQATFTSSDSNIMRRLPPGAFLRSRQYSESRTATARVRVRAAGVHTLLVSSGQQFGLIYVPEDAGEGDLSLKLRTLSLAGDIARSRNRFQYAVTLSSLPIVPQRVVLSAIDTSTRQLMGALASATRNFTTIDITVGANVNRWTLRTNAHHVRLGRERLFAMIFARPAARSAGSLYLGASRASALPNIGIGSGSSASETSAAGLDFAAWWSFGEAQKSVVQVGVTKVKTVSGDDGAWVERVLRGYGGPPQSPWQGTIAVRHRNKLVHVGSSVSLSRVRYGEVSNDSSPPAAQPSDIRRVAILGATVDIETDTQSPVFARMTMTASAPTWGDTLSTRPLRRTVARELRLTTSAQPLNNVRATAILHLASGTSWLMPDDRTVTAPAGRRLDLSIEKWAFSRNVRAQLVFRNLLNAREQYHPQGAQWNFRTLLSLTVGVP